MYQKDYILRMIQMFADMIAGILGLIRKGKIEEAQQSLDDAYYTFLKEDASFFNNIPSEDLTDKLLKEHNYTNGHLEILAGLFHAQAELSCAQKNPGEGIEYYSKSLILLEFIVKESKVFSMETDKKIRMISDRIVQLSNADS